MTVGGSEAIDIALRAMLNPGDEVLIPQPSYVSYLPCTVLADGVPVIIELEEKDRFRLTPEKLLEKITDKTKILILPFPNNPTGAIMEREDLEKIAKIVIEKDLFVLSDEIYSELTYTDRHVTIASLPGMKERTVLINGFSKAYAMTGWRLGYAAGPLSVIKAMTSFQSHSTSNANSIAQYATAVALTQGEQVLQEMIHEFDVRRRLMYSRINRIEGLKSHLPKGAFYMMLNISGLIGKKWQGQEIKDSMSFADILLTAKNVAMVPGIAFGAENYMRLSYATSQAQINKGMDRLEEFVSELE